METENKILVSYNDRVALWTVIFKKRFLQKEFPKIVKSNKKPAGDYSVADWLRY